MSELRRLWSALRDGQLTSAEQRRLAQLLAGGGSRGRRRTRALWLVAAAAVLALAAEQPVVPAVDAAFASVNGQPVAYGAFYTALADANGPESATRVVLEELMRQEALRLGCLPTDADVDQRVREIRAEDLGDDPATIKAWMAEKGADDAALRRLAYADLLDLRLRAFAWLKPTDDTVRAFFKEQQAKLYDMPEMVRYREIVLDTKEQALKVLAELNGGKLDFFTAASRYSNSTTKAVGGLVDPQSLPALTEIAPDVAAQLKKLTVLQYTPAPVSFRDRWFIVQLTERKPGVPAKFEDLATRVRRDYLQSKAVPAGEYYGKLAKGAQVSGLAERWQPVQAQFGAKGELKHFGKAPAEGDR